MLSIKIQKWLVFSEIKIITLFLQKSFIMWTKIHSCLDDNLGIFFFDVFNFLHFFHICYQQPWQKTFSCFSCCLQEKLKTVYLVLITNMFMNEQLIWHYNLQINNIGRNVKRICFPQEQLEKWKNRQQMPSSYEKSCWKIVLFGARWNAKEKTEVERPTIIT